MSRLNRVLRFAPETQHVTVEAGVSLGALYDFLLPKRLYLPIQPGHPQISVGACVACNVHGKNPQRDGTFADVVERLQLFHPAHGIMNLSREENAEVFELTCGGLGLTGVILSVTLRLRDLPAPIVEARKVPVRSLGDTLEQVDLLKSQYDFLYTWNDLSVFDERLGRGYIFCGRFGPAGMGADEPLPEYRTLDPVADAQRSCPRFFRPSTIPWITRIHFRWQMLQPTEEISLLDVMYPGIRESYFLNRHYFRLYGPSGLLAHMVLVPIDGWRAYVKRLERILRSHREPLLVTSIKAFAGSQRLLHFNGAGFSMHFHVPNSEGGRRLVADMEDLSREFQAVRTIYFDSRLTAAAAKHLFPEYDTFKQRLHRYDPDRTFVSSLSRRLDL
jgi:decaprenylphospho-beta-D-ribofuranose 2-oxidase